MSYERDFKGVWIPREIWLDDNLGWTEKMMYVEIDSLCKTNGCFASNKHFADFFGLSVGRVSKIVSSLKNKGYITVDVILKPGSKQVDKRIIKTTRGYGRERLGGIDENNVTPMVENVQGNNTIINNTINNTKDIMHAKSIDGMPTEMAQMILDYFNYKTQKSRPITLTDTNKKLLNRLYKKYKDINDYRYVIDNKYAEWHNNEKMKGYIKTSTLFAFEKFETYVEEDEYIERSIKQDNQSWGDLANEIRTDNRNTGEIINTVPKTLGWG